MLTLCSNGAKMHTNLIRAQETLLSSVTRRCLYSTVIQNEDLMNSCTLVLGFRYFNKMKVLIGHDMDTKGVFTPVFIGLIESNSSSLTPLVRIVWSVVNTAIGPVPNKLSTVEWMNQ